MTRERERGRDKPAAKTVGVRGRAGIDRVETEMQAIKDRQAKSYAPYRYRAGYDLKKGERNEIIFLDNSLEDAFFIHEHGVQDEKGNWGRNFEVCVKETDNCPLCALADGGAKNLGRSNYTMLLTVLDLRPYENRDGDTVEYSRKLFAVKGQQIPDWCKYLEKAEKKFGSLRGVYMDVGRSGKKDAGTGKPLPLETDWYGEDGDDKPYSNVDEKDLVKTYGHKAVMSEDGKRVIKEKDADITPYNYEELFPAPDVDALARKYGVKSRSAGSQADIDGEFDDDKPARRGRAERTRSRSDDEDDEGPRTRSRGRGRAEQDDADDEGEVRATEQDDEDDTPAPPARTRQKEADAKPSRSRSRAAEPDDEQETDDEEEKPAARSRSRKPAKDEDDEAPKGRSRSRSKAAEEEPEDESQDDDTDADEAPRSRVSARSRTKPSGSRKAAADEDGDEPF